MRCTVHAFLIANDLHDSLLVYSLEIRWIPSRDYTSSDGVLVKTTPYDYIARLNTSDGYTIGKAVKSNGNCYASYKRKLYFDDSRKCQVQYRNIH